MCFGWVRNAWCGTTAGAVYGHTGRWTVGSYFATGIAVRLLNASAARTLILLAAAAGLYYSFVTATITTAFAMEGVATVGIRVLDLTPFAAWLLRAKPFSGNNSAKHA